MQPQSHNISVYDFNGKLPLLPKYKKIHNSFATTSFGHMDSSVVGWNQSLQRTIPTTSMETCFRYDGKEYFLQINFLDSLADEVTAHGHSHFNQIIFTHLTEWLYDNNHYIQELKIAQETIVEDGNNMTRKFVL